MKTTIRALVYTIAIILCVCCGKKSEESASGSGFDGIMPEDGCPDGNYIANDYFGGFTASQGVFSFRNDLGCTSTATMSCKGQGRFDLTFLTRERHASECMILGDYQCRATWTPLTVTIICSGPPEDPDSREEENSFSMGKTFLLNQ